MELATTSVPVGTAEASLNGLQMSLHHNLELTRCSAANAANSPWICFRSGMGKPTKTMDHAHAVLATSMRSPRDRIGSNGPQIWRVDRRPLRGDELRKSDRCVPDDDSIVSKATRRDR